MTTLDIQRRLAALGFDPGPADGIRGPRTIRAIEAFQKERGLRVDGIVGPVTAAAMHAAPLRGGPDVLVPSVINAGSATAAAVVVRQPKASRSITEIIVHCTATPEGRNVSVPTIRTWHLANGWKDIGYHWIVKLDGSIEAGRPEAQVGSHVAGHNSGTLGVVYVGGVAADGTTPKDTRTAAQRAALLDLVKALIAKYPTVRKVTGHREYSPKACPSFDVRKDELGRLV
jgi:N-acetylmuramoyl-L-alanine amidase